MFNNELEINIKEGFLLFSPENAFTVLIPGTL